MFHPAIVHFPIAFAYLALLFSVIALFSRSKGFNLGFLILTVAMAFGATLAAMSGREAAAAAQQQLGQGIMTYVEDHAEWATFTVIMTWVSALSCFIQFLCVFPSGRKGYTIFSILTLISLIITGFAVYETGTRGGKLVYEHGAGVQNSDSPPPLPMDQSSPSQSRKSTSPSQSSSSKSSSPSQSSSSKSSAPAQSDSAKSSPSQRSQSSPSQGQTPSSRTMDTSEAEVVLPANINLEKVSK